MTNVFEATEHDAEKPFAMLVVPRGCYKSSIARAAIVWKYLRRLYLDENPHHRIVIASSTLALGKVFLSGIEAVVKSGGLNQRIDTHYCKLWKNRTMSVTGSKLEDGINFAPRCDAGEIASLVEPNVFIASMKRVSTGFHADEALIDDLNNRENVATDLQRAKTHDYWKLLFPIIGLQSAEGRPSRVMMLCTPWHDDDVRGMIVRKEEERAAADPKYVSPWTIIQQGSYYEDGTVFFPSKYPPKVLESLLEEMGPSWFSANFLCDPVGDDQFVSEEQIHWKDRESFPELKQIRICVDPNQHRDAHDLGCYAAIIVAGYDRFWHTWVLDVRGSREWGSQQFMNELFSLQEEYPSAMIYMEDSHMTHFQHAVMLEEALRSEKAGYPVRLRINYVPVDVKTQKYDRWQKLQPRFRNHAIHFSDRIAPALKAELKNELVRGRKARFVDFLDALAMTEQGYRPKADGAVVAGGFVPRVVRNDQVVRSTLGGILAGLERKR